MKALGPLLISPSPETVHRFVRENLAEHFLGVINPGAAERDSRGIPLDALAFQPAARLGLFAFLLPRELGGTGDRRTFGLLLEQIGYFCDELEFASLLSMYADVASTIAATNRSDLHDAYVVPMSCGARFGTFAYTEQTDALNFTCRAVKRGNQYILRGEKCLQTGGHLADVFLTYVRDEQDDLKLFLLERADPGMYIEAVPTAGFRSAGLTRLELRDVEVAETRVLARVDALSHAQRFLNDRRLFIACPMVGRMRSILSTCSEHLDTVVRYGAPLTQQQAVQAKLGRMFARCETARAVLHDALNHWAAGARNQLFDPTSTAAKYTIVENALALAQDAIYLTGWQGYSSALPYERMLRAFMSGIAGQTTQDVIELLLGNQVVVQAELSRHKKAVRI
jgi:alkylation response protein AidB-like acyl-CoA dehydrogenase